MATTRTGAVLLFGRCIVVMAIDGLVRWSLAPAVRGVGAGGANTATQALSGRAAGDGAAVRWEHDAYGLAKTAVASSAFSVSTAGLGRKQVQNCFARGGGLVDATVVLCNGAR
jgi:hypothetical protein